MMDDFYALYHDASPGQNSGVLFLVQRQDHEWCFDRLVEDTGIAIQAYRKTIELGYRKELRYTECFV